MTAPETPDILAPGPAPSGPAPALAPGSARRRDLAITGATLLLLLLWEFGGWDLPLTRLYGGADGFAWREAWVTRHLLHDGGRWVAGAVLAWTVWGVLRPPPGGPTRRERGYWLGVVFAALLFVPTLKRFSTTSCPWDLAGFGGLAPYVPHWLPRVVDGGPGHCFPSGHAVAAFAFFGLYFLWRPHRPCRARALLVATLVAGAIFGWAQLARGAHFASHTLWSAWLCWALSMAAQWGAPAARAARPAG